MRGAEGGRRVQKRRWERCLAEVEGDCASGVGGEGGPSKTEAHNSYPLQIYCINN